MRQRLTASYLFSVAAAIAGVPVLAQEPVAAPKTEPWLARAVAVPPPRDAASPAAPSLEPGGAIVCIGDSITAGGGYLRDMDEVFARQYPELKMPKVINAGISGQKAESLDR